MTYLSVAIFPVLAAKCRRTLLPVVLVSMLGGVFSVVSAQIANTEVLQTKFLYDGAQFRKSIEKGRQLLKKRQNLLPEAIAFIHQYSGLSFYNLGNQDSSRAHFLSLLSLHPDFELDPVQISPKIITFFNDIKDAVNQLPEDLRAPSFRQYILLEDKRPQASWRSAVLPGWGQFHKKQHLRGYVFGGLFWGSAIATGFAFLQEDRAKQDYLDQQLPSAAAAAYKEYDQWYRRKRYFAIAASLLWAVNVGDAMWSREPQPAVQLSWTPAAAGSLQLTFAVNRP